MHEICKVYRTIDGLVGYITCIFFFRISNLAICMECKRIKLLILFFPIQSAFPSQHPSLCAKDVRLLLCRNINSLYLHLIWALWSKYRYTAHQNQRGRLPLHSNYMHLSNMHITFKFVVVSFCNYEARLSMDVLHIVLFSALPLFTFSVMEDMNPL